MKQSNFFESKLFIQIKAIAITTVLDFICYIFIGYWIAAGIVDGYYSQFAGNLMASVAATVLYAVIFHWFYTGDLKKAYLVQVDVAKPFSWKKEARNFFREECLPLLKIYGFITLVYELIILVFTLLQMKLPWFLAYIVGFLFPLRIADNTLNLSLSPFLSVPVIVAFLVLFAVVSRLRLYKRLKREHS